MQCCTQSISETVACVSACMSSSQMESEWMVERGVTSVCEKERERERVCEKERERESRENGDGRKVK